MHPRGVQRLGACSNASWRGVAEDIGQDNGCGPRASWLLLHVIQHFSPGTRMKKVYPGKFSGTVHKRLRLTCLCSHPRSLPIPVRASSWLCHSQCTVVALCVCLTSAPHFGGIDGCVLSCYWGGST